MAKKEYSLAHTKWMCKYHIVFTPKYRRKIIYNQYKADIRDIIKQLCSYKGVEIIEGHLMPDHIHMILIIDSDENGRTQFAPTVSRVMKQFKGSITKQIGRPIWQKSFYDHGIRNQQDYNEIWQYIENNPLKYALKKAP